MAQIITNQASIAYRYNNQAASAVSNVATTLLNEPLAVSKVSLETGYRLGDDITYVVTVTNGGTSTLTGVTLVDNLGTYTTAGGTATPLTYVGPALYFVDGVSAGNITPTVGADGISFTPLTLGAGSTAQVIYKAAVNDRAPLATDGEIINTVTATATGINTPVSDDNTITVEDYADVTINKSMTPATVSDGDLLTYTFVISNFGNSEATDIVLTDDFDPAPENITVQVNGAAVATTDYTYQDGVLTLPGTGATTQLTLPPATVTQDPATGVVTVTPSTLTVTVTGTI